MRCWPPPPLLRQRGQEYRTGTQTRIGAFLGIKEDPTPTAPGTFGALLPVPLPFVPTQSLTFLAKGHGDRHDEPAAPSDGRRRGSGGHQGDELNEAQDDLISNRFAAREKAQEQKAKELPPLEPPTR